MDTTKPLHDLSINDTRFTVGRTDLRDLAFLRPRVDVLVVVDSDIQVADIPGTFGVGRFIRLLRESTVGCTGFRVDVASRDTDPFSDDGAGGDGHIRYRGFRFDSTVGATSVIDRYDEIFMFGFKPDNDGLGDDRIDNAALPGVVPMDASERDAIAGWMDDGGGVFATGDHDYLGATMCHHIPRVRSMRKWTNADGVPPIGGPTRIDTNRPATPAQAAGVQTIPTTVERDDTPQPIEWVPVIDIDLGLLRYRRPHELLCHPTLGPIDVMPDHPHEGLCFTPAEIQADSARRAEFPGTELPFVIAYGNVVPDPPYDHAKGTVNPRRFPMISAYDGTVDGVGRIVVDSTWHHWFNMNINGIEAAGGDDWDKISRYFLNVARWIARPGSMARWCWWELIAANWKYVGREEFRPRGTARDLGRAAHTHLSASIGPCAVWTFEFDLLCALVPGMCDRFVEEFRLPRPDPCLTCPPFDLLGQELLGGAVRALMPLAERIELSLARGEGVGLEIDLDEVEKVGLEGARTAAAEFGRRVLESVEGVQKLFETTLDGLDVADRFERR